jgi:hypothetical protein
MVHFVFFSIYFDIFVFVFNDIDLYFDKFFRNEIGITGYDFSQGQRMVRREENGIRSGSISRSMRRRAGPMC